MATSRAASKNAGERMAISTILFDSTSQHWNTRSTIKDDWGSTSHPDDSDVIYCGLKKMAASSMKGEAPRRSRTVAAQEARLVRLEALVETQSKKIAALENALATQSSVAEQQLNNLRRLSTALGAADDDNEHPLCAASFDVNLLRSEE